MCGFTGYFLFEGKKEKSNKQIVEMLALQKHRGPDDSGIAVINTFDNKLQELQGNSITELEIEANLVFGFNRLSILDLSHNGHQPMFGANEKVVLMMNGEIYNAFDFKPALQEKGYHFRSTTDTEVVLNLYLEHGIEGMLQRLNGMFAIAIYDARIDKLFIARDRFGIKPIYVAMQNGMLAFASEMKSFKAISGFKFELNEDGLDEFLMFRNLINETLFKGINNLTQGTYLIVDPEGLVQTKTYYNINQEGENKISNNLAKELLETALRDSVKSQLISDVKLGCQLSGGVDSSLVTWYANQLKGGTELETISIIFEEKSFSEEKYIDKVASVLKLKAHKFVLNEQTYFDLLDKASWHFEQPVNHPNTIGIYLLSKFAREHLTVLLSGEGADELLAGYERFSNLTQNPIMTRNFWARFKQNIKHPLAYLALNLGNEERIIMGNSFGSISNAFEIRNGFSIENAIKKRKKLLEGLDGDIFDRQRKYEMLTYLPDLLMRQDKMSMASSIENRVPFLDNNLVTTGFSISKEQLIQNKSNRLEGKFALKNICADKFDEAFAFRDKMGFGIPIRRFLGSQSFEQRWQDEILPGIKSKGIFDSNSIAIKYEQMKKGNAADAELVWLMTSFEIWANQYLS